MQHKNYDQKDMDAYSHKFNKESGLLTIIQKQD